MGLFGVQVLVTLYYLPQTGKSLMNFFEYSSTNTFIYFLNSILRLGMTVLGVVGMFQFWQNRNIFNPYLKAFFIYNLFSFLVYLPNNIAILFSDYVPESIGLSLIHI